ncbi:MAG: right-handed parallel beta-helix repeat-containing protein [Melioribacteraceae bacterium]|nr:right-handed parallel beta-helix repeat-containing protein [Melioribacteraceae bacterium]
MKCNQAVKLFFLLFLSINLFAGNDNHKEYFISPSGSDKNNGSIKAPFATIERARDAVRADKLKFPKTSYTVFLRGGTYQISKTIEFDQRDTYKNDEQLIIRSYKNEVVRISGGIKIPENRVRKIADSTISRRLITRVTDNILQIDYSGLIDDEGTIQPHGFGRPYTNTQMELFGMQNAYFLARWPNKGYTRIKNIIEKGSSISDGDTSEKLAVFEYEAERVGRWKNSEEPWIAGYFRYGFADDAVRIRKIDPEKKEITSDPTYYGFSAGEPFNAFYGFNILEDIDIPGEYFVDKKNKKIYFYPYDNEDFSDLTLSLINEPLIALENSAKVCFENIIFECTRGMGVYIEGGNDNRFTSCTFRNIGTVAVCIGKGVDENGVPASRKLGKFKEYLYVNQTWDRNCGTDHVIENCEIFNTGAGGIILGGGDRKTLTRGNNRVTNCSIHDFNRYEKTYRGGINVDGVGNVIDHNEIFNCPGTAIHLNGNEHLIEYNIIHDAVTDGHDMGAIYYGRNPSEQGNIVRYNYFHHNGNKDGVIMSVYHDDGACGMQVYGNVFYKPGNVAVMIGGGNDIVYRNNIFIETPLAFHIDNRLQNWGGEEFIKNNGVYNKRLSEVAIDKLPYSKKYPNLANYWNDNLGVPKRNIIENNLFVNIGQLQNGSLEWLKLGKNCFTKTDPGFESYAKMNFKLRNDSKVFSSLPDFENVPFEKMGRQK